jgi:AraC-like DNA-binding protein/predicted negative regulator of RcsB-dependent stress response
MSACSNNDGDAGEFSKRVRYTSEDLNSALTLLSEKQDDIVLNRKVWSYYTESGQYEALISHAAPVFDRSYGLAGRERLALLSGAFISQAYVFREKFDSVAFYLDRIMLLAGSEHGDDFIVALVHNTAAMYILKTELDYSAALKHYEAAYEIMVRTGETINQGTLLCNIASIYVSLRDPAGFEYARKAYDIINANQSDMKSYSQVFSTILLAQMYYLKGDFPNALLFVNKVSGEVSAFPQFVSSLDLLYADIALEAGDYREAEYYYRKALDSEKNTEPGVNALIYLRYGTMLSDISRYSEAKNILRRGLDTHSMEHRHELLAELSDLAMQMGDDKEALDYYKEYHTWLDSVSYIQRERAFKQYLLLAKDVELQSSELDLLKANRRIIIIVAVSVPILILAVALWVANRRKKWMYRHLVETHQQLLARVNDVRLPGDDDGAGQQKKDERDLELWNKLHELMTSERIYRYSDISLERTAEILGTNRAYVSRVINNYSGMSFSHYIHSQRIEDASRILSDISNDVSLKAMAFELGYNSISSFYRAFIKETGVPPSKYREEVQRIKKT